MLAEHPIRAAALPEQRESHAVSVRRADGKARRGSCPRGSFAAWRPASQRADPVDLLIADSQGRMETLVPIRYGRMISSPFAFYRGAAAIMAYDQARREDSGIPVVISGDAHLKNFGGFRTPERRLIFDINDFDEASVAPWEWDVQRLATSFHIAATANGLDKASRDEAAWSAARAYRKNMARYAEMPVLEAHYEYIDLTKLVVDTEDGEVRRATIDQIAKATQSDAADREFAKMTHVIRDHPRIRNEPPLIFHMREIYEGVDFHEWAQNLMANYRQNLSPERRVLFDRFVLADVAMKVVGVGSVGTRCAVALYMSGDNDPLFLQIKEARPSVLEPYAGEAPFQHAGERVVFCQRLMQAASDVFLGPAQGPRRPFYVRQLRDAKVSPDVTMMNAENLVNYAKACGWALARAHKRSGDAAMLSGYMGRSDAFEDAITGFAQAYARQNEADHDALIAAVRSDRVKARKDLV
ncbi:MAG TPA: DUF2252 domain-containing protein [Caulobacteraceae bacterium]|jgi:uncharacterized protein (DUF2252 family)